MCRTRFICRRASGTVCKVLDGWYPTDWAIPNSSCKETTASDAKLTAVEVEAMAGGGGEGLAGGGGSFSPFSRPPPPPGWLP